jgi:peptide/nickel transport system substrate-binding protein
MTSRDVRATYEKIINPPPGITSARKGEYLQIETVQAPEPYIVAFKLKWPSPSFIHSLASPWNWIYKADILERDIRWYERNIMGTGPFVFVEHVKGSRWVGRRNPSTGTGNLSRRLPGAVHPKTPLRSGHPLRTAIQFRGFSPAQRDDIVRTLGEKITVQESPWNCALVVAINHEREPFHDRGVRRALSLALDRYGAASALSKSAIVRGGACRPGIAPCRRAVKPAATGRHPAITVEARRLLAEAGSPRVCPFLKNRTFRCPTAHRTWLVDQWRQID